MSFQKKYIITGGPGAGKTSLLQALKAKGFDGVEEASRQLITELVAAGSDCLPWNNLPLFAEKVLERMILTYQAVCSKEDIIFFDRGIPDIIAYLNVAGLPVPQKYNAALQQHPYHPLVFILPPWEEIYINDAERWQTFEESVQLYTAIQKTYQDAGYKLIEVPKVSVEERVTFIQKILVEAL